MTMKNLRLRPLMLLVFYIASCKTAEFGHKTLDVNGMIYDFENRPVSNYTIAIGEEEKYSSVTDINGRFLIPKVPYGSHSLHGEKFGYESYQGEILINDRGQIVYVRIPSFRQLLDLADEAISGNDFATAEEFLNRARTTGQINAELVLYEAILEFRQGKYDAASGRIRAAMDAGMNDKYLEIFLNDILRIWEEMH